MTGLRVLACGRMHVMSTCIRLHAWVPCNLVCTPCCMCSRMLHPRTSSFKSGMLHATIMQIARQQQACCCGINTHTHQASVRLHSHRMLLAHDQTFERAKCSHLRSAVVKVAATAAGGADLRLAINVRARHVLAWVVGALRRVQWGAVSSLIGLHAQQQQHRRRSKTGAALAEDDDPWEQGQHAADCASACSCSSDMRPVRKVLCQPDSSGSIGSDGVSRAKRAARFTHHRCKDQRSQEEEGQR